MKNIWLLAAAEEAGTNEGEVITMEDTAQTEAVTTQDGTNGTPAEGEGTEPKPANYLPIVMMVILGIYMFFMMFRGPKKKQQEHKKMVSSLSKNDRIRTIGGIFGTVIDVRDDEIILKIDESNNTKMRISPQAIATVLNNKTE